MIRVSSQRIWRLDERPYPNAIFRIGDRTFTILSVDEGPERFGRPTTLLTIKGTCTVCGHSYTFEATKSRLGPVQTCSAHRRTARRASTQVTKPTSLLKPAKPYPTPPVPKVGERLSYALENCTVAKVNADGTAEIDFEDGTYDVVPYRKLRRRR